MQGIREGVSAMIKGISGGGWGVCVGRKGVGVYKVRSAMGRRAGNRARGSPDELLRYGGMRGRKRGGCGAAR